MCCSSIGGIANIECPLVKLGVPEALWVLLAVNFGPLVVGMDSHGVEYYKELEEKAKKREEIYR